MPESQPADPFQGHPDQGDLARQLEATATSFPLEQAARLASIFAAFYRALRGRRVPWRIAGDLTLLYAQHVLHGHTDPDEGETVP